jgi:hypothetical protein
MSKIKIFVYYCSNNITCNGSSNTNGSPNINRSCKKVGMEVLVGCILTGLMELVILVGTRDGQTQSARACKPVLLHLALRTWVLGPR